MVAGGVHNELVGRIRLTRGPPRRGWRALVGPLQTVGCLARTWDIRGEGRLGRSRCSGRGHQLQVMIGVYNDRASSKDKTRVPESLALIGPRHRVVRRHATIVKCWLGRTRRAS